MKGMEEQESEEDIKKKKMNLPKNDAQEDILVVIVCHCEDG